MKPASPYDSSLGRPAKPSGHEFVSVNELVRQDAEHIQVPPAVAARLRASLAREPKPTPGGGSWWRRWLAGGG